VNTLHKGDDDDDDDNCRTRRICGRNMGFMVSARSL
jgi:hypothetical protein